MEGDGGGSHRFGYPTRLQEGEVVVVSALSELDGDRYVAGGGHSGTHDVLEQPWLQRDGRTPTLARHLGHRTSEVHVDVVDPSLTDQQVDGPADALRFGSVELDAAG